MKLIDHLIIAFGTLMILLAFTVVSLGFLWHTIKPLVEKTEIQLLDANVSKLYHLKHDLK